MRFTLRFLLGAILVTGIYSALIFAVPTIVAMIGLMLLTVAIPSLIVGGIVYSRGTTRAYWIGCAASGCVPLLFCIYLQREIFIALLESGGQLGFYGPVFPLGISICHAVVLTSGWIVVLIRWLYYSRDHVGEPSGQTYSVLHERMSVQDTQDGIAMAKVLET